jgi:metal-responsive CopG/Arc/MetJ family transcriptional regulator
MGRTTKLTVSLPRELVSVADRIAREKKISRSKVISACLQELAEKQKLAEMTEGYLNMAKEQKQFAEVASLITSEVLPEWK